MNITPTKLTISQLLSSSNEQFIVPSYQRRYAWGYNQYLALYEDIEMLKENDGHLFGTIILHSNQHVAGINQPEIIDGQQRITTLILFLKAFETSFRKLGKETKATEVRKIVTCHGLDDIEKSKLVLGELDNPDIEQLVLNDNSVQLSNTKISETYESYVNWLGELDFPALSGFYYKLTNIAVIIRLDVGIAQDAYKLFETINNRGLRLTSTDIIKNFLLGHAAKINDQKTLENVKAKWSEIIRNLDGIDTDDFLRQLMCSILHRKITMSKLVQEFKKYYLKNVLHGELLGEFEYYSDDFPVDEDEGNDDQDENNDLDTQEGEKFTIEKFLTDLSHLSYTYKQISTGTFSDKKLNRYIVGLNKILSKPTYIFLVHFLQSAAYSSKYKQKVLQYVETLMLRRHICESRTSENDDIFSKLVPLINKENLLELITEYVSTNEYMPDDESFELSLPKHQFKGRLVNRAKYILERIEYFERGETQELVISSDTEVHLEHIIPQTINTKKSKDEFGDWVSYLGNNSVAKHAKYVNYIGNMTLLGESLNIQAYNNPFAKKKSSYRQSNFLITSQLAIKNDFKFSHVDSRGEDLTKTALKIWKS